MCPFLFRLGPGEDAIYMRVQGFHPIQAAPKDAFDFCIRAADQEKLPVFHDMGKIIIGRIAPVAEIDSRRAAGWAGPAASTIWQKALYSLCLRPGWMTRSVKRRSRME